MSIGYPEYEFPSHFEQTVAGGPFYEFMSIVMHPEFRDMSPEEMRLNVYQTGRVKCAKGGCRSQVTVDDASGLCDSCYHKEHPFLTKCDICSQGQTFRIVKKPWFCGTCKGTPEKREFARKRKTPNVCMECGYDKAWSYCITCFGSLCLEDETRHFCGRYPQHGLTPKDWVSGEPGPSPPRTYGRPRRG